MSERKVGTVSTTPSMLPLILASLKRRSRARTSRLSRRSMPSPNSTISAVSPAGRILYSRMTGIPPNERLGDQGRSADPELADLHRQDDASHGGVSAGRNQGLTLVPR